MPPRPAEALPPRHHPLGQAQEQMLLADLRRLDGKVGGRTVAELRLSRMHPLNRRDSRLRDITDAFSAAVVSGVRMYWTRTWDLIAIFDEEARPAFESGLVHLRFVLADDPLADATDLVTYRAFGEEHEALIAEAEERVAGTALAGPEADAAEERRRLTFRTRGRVARGEPLTPAMLGRIESMLVTANLSSHVRRQPVCAVVKDGRPDPLFTEVFVSIADLRETLLPSVDLAADPWLFQRLTQTLDRRVLALLSHRDDATLTRGFSLNLNVNSILSDEFIAFDDSLAPGAHGTVVIELRAEDIFADLGAYTFARDFVRQRGYRVCLDGVTWRALPYVDPKRLGAEMLKLTWQPDLPEVLESPEGAAALAAIRAVPSGRLILARCDSDAAIAFGRDHGIALFQGRLIDEWMRR